jgi:hypothetical protein
VVAPNLAKKVAKRHVVRMVLGGDWWRTRMVLGGGAVDMVRMVRGRRRDERISKSVQT